MHFRRAAPWREPGHVSRTWLSHTLLLPTWRESPRHWDSIGAQRTWKAGTESIKLEKSFRDTELPMKPGPLVRFWLRVWYHNIQTFSKWNCHETACIRGWRKNGRHLGGLAVALLGAVQSCERYLQAPVIGVCCHTEPAPSSALAQDR